MLQIRKISCYPADLYINIIDGITYRTPFYILPNDELWTSLWADCIVGFVSDITEEHRPCLSNFKKKIGEFSTCFNLCDHPGFLNVVSLLLVRENNDWSKVIKSGDDANNESNYKSKITDRSEDHKNITFTTYDSKVCTVNTPHMRIFLTGLCTHAIKEIKFMGTLSIYSL